MDRFNIVFHGEFLLGYDIDKAKDKLAGIFKLSSRKLDALFGGKTVTIRKNVNEIEGQQIVAAAARCGVVFELVAAAPPPDGRIRFRAGPTCGRRHWQRCAMPALRHTAEPGRHLSALR